MLIVVGWFGAAGAGAFLYQRVGSIPTIDFTEGVLGPEPGTPEAPKRPKNYLLVGSDTRAGQDTTSFGSATETGPQRADTMMLIRVDPGSAKAAALSLPRDLWVPIYDVTGDVIRHDRINTAFRDGAAGLVSTIRHNFGITIDHYAQVDFRGFRGLVDAVGGVELYLAGPVRDRDQLGRNISGLDINTAGCVQLNGDQALAYVRSRHFEQFLDGRWRRDLSSDLGRIARQQDFLRRVVSHILDRGLTNPARIVELLDVAEENLVVDDSLSAKDALRVGQRFRALAPDTLNQRSLAAEDFETSAGAQVLRLLDVPENDAAFDVFRGISPPPSAEPAGRTTRESTMTSRASTTTTPAC